MSEQTNAEYFRMRATDERQRAQRANDSRAAGAHAEMAERYDELANSFEASQPKIFVLG
ncbi:hypothetical protein [Sphingomonas sp. URHD0057]|uniref:hypothetical protein n=1 Tax=Sphingomonas sp. URHD0057 TaxID=1380389 RepID=UPI0012DC23BC|nr:hypothetical protein [Sphingomonas sp. URHD0057]